MECGRYRRAYALLALVLTTQTVAAATEDLSQNNRVVRSVSSPTPASTAEEGARLPSHQPQTVVGRAFFVVAPADGAALGEEVLATPSGARKVADATAAGSEVLETAATKGTKSYHKKGDDGKGKGGKHYNEGFYKGHNIKEKKGHHHDKHYGRKTHGDYEHKGADKHGGGGTKGYKGSDHKEKHKSGYKKGDKGQKGKKFGHKGNFHKGHHDKGFKHKEHKDAHGHKHDDQYKKKTGKYGSSYDEEEGYYKKGKGKKHDGGKFAEGQTWDHSGGDSFSIKGKYHEDYSDVKGKHGYDGYKHHQHKKGAKGGHKKGKSHKDGDKYKHKHGDGGGGYHDHTGHHSHTGPVHHHGPTYYRVAPRQSPAGGRHPPAHHQGSHSTQEAVQAPPENKPDTIQSRQLLLNPRPQRLPRLRQHSQQRPRYVIQPSSPIVLVPQYNKPRPQYVLMHPQNALNPHGPPQFVHPNAAHLGHPHPGQTRNHLQNPFFGPRIIPRPHHGRPQHGHPHRGRPGPPHPENHEEEEPQHEEVPEEQPEDDKTSSSYITYGDPKDGPRGSQEPHHNNNEGENAHHDNPPRESRRPQEDYSQPELQNQHYQDHRPNQGAGEEVDSREKQGSYRNSNRGNRGRTRPRKNYKKPPVYKNEIPDDSPHRYHERPNQQGGDQPATSYTRERRPKNNDDIYILYPNREQSEAPRYRGKEQVQSNTYEKVEEPEHRNEEYNLPEKQEPRHQERAPRYHPRGHSRNSKKRPDESRHEEETQSETHPREQDEGRHHSEGRPPGYNPRNNNEEYSRSPPRSQSSQRPRPHRPRAEPDHEDAPHDPQVDDRRTTGPKHESRPETEYHRSQNRPSSHQEYNRRPSPEEDPEDHHSDGRRDSPGDERHGSDEPPHPRSRQPHGQESPQVSAAPHNPLLAPAQTAYRASSDPPPQPGHQKLQPAASGFSNGHAAFSFDSFGEFGQFLD